MDGTRCMPNALIPRFLGSQNKNIVTFLGANLNF